MLWEAETTANSDVFEGQVAKKQRNLQCFLTQRPKTVVFASNRAAENTGIYDGFSSFEDSRQTSTKDKNTVKTSVSGLKKIRK